MLEKLVKPGDKVEVKKISALGAEADEDKYYISSVMDILDENRIGISMPLEHGGIIPLEVGERYKLCFYGQNGLYQSKGLVKERYKRDNFYIAEIKFIADMEKLQRRQFFRLDCLINIKYRTIDEIPAPNSTPKQYGPWQTAMAIDVSGGGMRFNCIEYKPSEKFYEVTFSIAINNAMKEITTPARVVYISDIPNRTGMYEYRIEFKGINAKDREMIVRYVFDEERKRRQKDIK